MNTFNNTTKVFSFRISQKLLETLRTLAQQNKRTLGKEIEFRLEQSLKS